MEGLTAAHPGDRKLYTVYNLIGMAAFFSREARHATSVALPAAAAGTAGSIGLKIEPGLQEHFDQVLAKVRGILAEEGFGSAREAGKTWILNVQYNSL